MKLYTEEQVKQMIEKSRETGLTSEYLILTTTPIELPSDEEIVNQSKYIAHNYFEMHHANHYQGLEEGSLRMASWMRDKIYGGNNGNS